MSFAPPEGGRGGRGCRCGEGVVRGEGSGGGSGSPFLGPPPPVPCVLRIRWPMRHQSEVHVLQWGPGQSPGRLRVFQNVPLAPRLMGGGGAYPPAPL